MSFNPVFHLNKSFENANRLGIMTLLMYYDKLDFSGLKKALEISDGNLSSHLKFLQNEGFIKMEKQFIDLKPNTSYELTENGKEQFIAHLKALETLVKLKNKPNSPNR